jgi:hypothetical protein
MGAPFTVDNPATGQVVLTADGLGNTTQIGTETAQDVVLGPLLTNPTSPAPGYIKIYSPDGESINTVDASGVQNPLAFSAAFAPVVQTSAVTVTGTTSTTLLSAGITIPAGGLAAGQAYRFVSWGTVTTTVDTQTVTIILKYGGVSGTTLLSFGAQTPNSGAPVTGVAWRVEFDFTAVSATSISVSGDDALNFFTSSVSQATVTGLTNTTAEQLVITVANSATAVTIQSAGAYCVRLA